MAGYRETFGSNVDYAFSGGKRAGGMFDITSRLDKAASSMSQFTSKVRSQGRAMRDLATEQRSFNDQLSKLQQGTAEYAKIEGKLAGVAEKISRVRKEMMQVPFDMVAGGFDKVAKGILKLNFGMLTTVFDFLIDSIKRVYELQERWTKAIGGFNLKMGGLTSGLKGATRAATQWSSTIRGLTGGDITEGIEMFSEFSMSISRVIEKGDQFSKFGIALARGFNLGGAGAGQLAKVFSNVGMSAGESAQAMSEMVDGANLAKVPVNLLAKDIEQSSVYMARFGKEGAKAFVTAAAYARKFTMSMQDLQKATERFDLFEDAARMSAKLNAAFGTMTNSIDLMLTDDPAQRMEMIRQQFLAQGLTYDKLTVKQRRFASETLQVSDDQLASLLSIQNAGTSYAEFQAKQAAKQKSELQAKKQMEVALRKTAQTMYAFGMAFDRVTVAIGNAIKPLLVVLGLAKEGDKKFTSFGQVMESITVTVEEFFNSLAKNVKWQNFMRELAKDLQRFGRALRDWVLNGGAAELVGDLAVGMKKFYGFLRDSAIVIVTMLKPLLPVFLKLAEYSKEIVLAWAGMKIARGAAGIAGGLSEMAGLAPNVMRQQATKRGKGMALGGLLGVGVGAFTGSMGVETGTGAAIGGALGGMLGPTGAIVGALGGAVIEGVVRLFRGSRAKSELDKARDSLKAAIDEQQRAAKEHASILDMVSERMKYGDMKRAELTGEINKLEDRSRKTKGKLNVLSEDERSNIVKRVKDLERFGVKTKDTGKLLAMLSAPAGGPIVATDAQLKRLADASASYEDEIAKLRQVTMAEVERQMAAANATSASAAADLAAKQKGRELEIAKKQLEQARTSGAEMGHIGPGKISEELARFMGLTSASMAKGLPEKQLKHWAREFAMSKAKEKVTNLEKDVAELQEKAVDAKMNLDKKLFLIQARGAIKSETRFLEFEKSQRAAGETDSQKIFQRFAALNAQELIATYGDYFEELVRPKAMASGGIVRRPTLALIGEAGAEAVVPLRAMARGRMQQPRKFGGQAARSLVGGGSSGGGSQHVTIEVPVSIDGREVSRSIVATALRSR